MANQTISKAEQMVYEGPSAFRKETEEAPLVVLYPRNRYRNVYLSRYLKEPDTGLHYYALQTSDRNLRKFLNNLIDDLDATTRHFGANLRASLSAKGKAPDLAAALAEDLAGISSEPFTLLLDQFDRLPEKDETKRFMEVLIDKLPDHCQLLINAREQAYLPWFDLVEAQKAHVLGAEYVPEEGGPPPAEPEVPTIEVYSLGRGYCLVNGVPVTHWEGELPKNLFFFFMDHNLVTRDEIFDVFWPTLSVKEATNVFHVTKRKINERLGYDLTQYASGFYSHSEELNIYYDVASFSKAIEEAMMADEDAQLEFWKQAVQTYRAPFLHRLDMDWADSRRKELREQFAQALIGLGRIHQARNNLDNALTYYQEALIQTPQREDIHRQVMDLYYRQGRMDEAVQQFRALENTLRATLNISPSPETVNLYKLIVGDDGD
ncbi:MAG: bacterial transcriptional activator domain-containing protein [Anaerolineae bacterium]|nr:bacterial transcriptional activator domain-containing protein [Anaerolineae bacterium]